MSKVLVDYCDSCEETFIENSRSGKERYYDSDICYKCAEAQWEHWNDRQSEYWV